jgi:hypothetical protein
MLATSVSGRVGAKEFLCAARRSFGASGRVHFRKRPEGQSPFVVGQLMNCNN